MKDATTLKKMTILLLCAAVLAAVIIFTATTGDCEMHGLEVLAGLSSQSYRNKHFNLTPRGV